MDTSQLQIGAAFNEVSYMWKTFSTQSRPAGWLYSLNDQQEARKALSSVLGGR